MPWQDQRGIVREDQVFGRHFNALRANAVNFRQHVPRINHDAIADDRELAAANEARRQQRKLEHFAVNDQRMARIVAALETHHDIGPAREPVDDLALAFIAPLGAYDDDT